MNKKNISKEVLEKKYIEEGKSWAEIAEDLNCNYATVFKYKKQFNIKNRGRSKLKGINKIGLIGRKFGCVRVIKFSKSSNDGARVWECKCDCGETRYITTEHLKNEYSKCWCSGIKNRIDGFGKIPSWYVSKVARSCKRRSKDISFNVDVKYLDLIFTGKCAFSGVEICFNKQSDYTTTASLDRIDSDKGYIEGNVQWVHKDVNIMKQEMKDDEFINWCDKISKFRK